MNSLVITFNGSQERLYKVSIQENKTSRGQKRARIENELLALLSLIHFGLFIYAIVKHEFSCYHLQWKQGTPVQGVHPRKQDL